MWNSNDSEITLHLIRHGRTSANARRLYCGFTNVDLSDEGISELIELKNRVCYPSADIYINSGMLRTIHTTNVLFGQTDLVEISDIKEMNFGEFEMYSYEELKNNIAYRKWILDVENEQISGGESKKTFLARITTGFEKIIVLCQERGCKSAIVVTHGGVISTIMGSIFNENKNFYEWQPSFGRGYSLNIKKSDYIKYKTI